MISCGLPSISQSRAIVADLTFAFEHFHLPRGMGNWFPLIGLLSGDPAFGTNAVCVAYIRFPPPCNVVD